MKDIVKLIVSLGLVCAIGCAALVCVNQLTEGPRDAARLQTLKENLLMVLPADTKAEFTEEKTMEIDGVVFHRAYEKGKLSLLVAETSGAGFGGDIKALVGIQADTDEIIRVVVTEHNETPGLGSQATDRKVQKSLWHGSALKEGELAPNNYLDSYIGKKIDDKYFVLGHPKKDDTHLIQGVSGATYSSKGVLSAVNRARDTYRIYREELHQ